MIIEEIVIKVIAQTLQDLPAYLIKAPDEAGYPVVVYQPVSSLRIWSFDTTIEDVMVLFSIYDNKSTISSVSNLMDILEDRFHRQKSFFTSENDVMLICAEKTSEQLETDENKYWTGRAMYKFKLEKPK